jgi:hypothetical protein
MNTFREGDSVRFKDGVRHADLDLDIGGWQGRVEVDLDAAADNIVLVLLDSVTLNGLSEAYIIDAEENGLAWNIYYEAADNLEHTNPRDTLEETEAAYAELSQRYRWFHLGEEGAAIQAIVQEADDYSWKALERWHAYLSKALTFPFKAIISEWSSHGSHVRIGDKVRVQALGEIYDNVGILVTVKRRYSTFELPLCDLKVEDESASQHDPVQLYVVWFANR